ncbi:Flp pilus assembly complex ATPase component TadA [bacterium]|nr:Flp pilus assembly complex ATPase component TadA [bacterium]
MSLSERLKNFDMYSQEDEENSPISPEITALCSELTKSLSKKIATIPIWFEYSKEEQQKLIRDFLNVKLNEQFSEIKLTAAEKERISSTFFNSVYGFGSLDFLISRENVSKIFVNSPMNIYVEADGHIEKADVVIDKNQFNSLINRLTEISGKSSSVITFRFNNLLVTILREPVCATTLILKKVSDINYDFGYFERRDVLNTDISAFLRAILNSKKRILISSPAQCGKTSVLNSFINEAVQDSRMVLFEEGALINSTRSSLSRFDVEGLKEKERHDLITAALYYKPDYIFSDINDIDFNIEIAELSVNSHGFISTVRADSFVEAFSFYTSVWMSRLKCTEKLAKVRFAKDIDYIIQLRKEEDYFRIASIVAVSANKAGTPVLNELLTYKSGEYKYKFDDDILTDKEDFEYAESYNKSKSQTPKQQKLTFSARLGV